MDIIILAVSILIVFIAVIGYDHYIAGRFYPRVTEGEEYEGPPEISEEWEVKAVKASKVGDYLIVTTVLAPRNGSGESSVEIDDPSLLIPLAYMSKNVKREEVIS